jgi:hypothetical protein
VGGVDHLRCRAGVPSVSRCRGSRTGPRGGRSARRGAALPTGAAELPAGAAAPEGRRLPGSTFAGCLSAGTNRPGGQSLVRGLAGRLTPGNPSCGGMIDVPELAGFDRTWVVRERRFRNGTRICCAPGRGAAKSSALRAVTDRNRSLEARTAVLSARTRPGHARRRSGSGHFAGTPANCAWVPAAPGSRPGRCMGRNELKAARLIDLASDHRGGHSSGQVRRRATAASRSRYRLSSPSGTTAAVRSRKVRTSSALASSTACPSGDVSEIITSSRPVPQEGQT